MSYEFDPNEVSGTPVRRTGIGIIQITDAFDLMNFDPALPANKEKVEKMKIADLIDKVKANPKNIQVLQVIGEVDSQSFRKLIFGGQKTMWKIGNVYAAAGVFANKPRNAEGKVSVAPADLIGRKVKTLFFKKGKYTEMFDFFPIDTADNIIQTTFDTDDWLQNKIREMSIPDNGELAEPVVAGDGIPLTLPGGTDGTDEPLPF